MVAEAGVPRSRVVAIQATFSNGRIQIGSGFLVGGRRVLTAEHCTRDKITQERPVKLAVVRNGKAAIATVAAACTGLDIAVLNLGDDTPWETLLPCVTFARVYRKFSGVLENCEGIGYPLFQRDPNKGTWNTSEVHGDIYPTDEGETGRLLLRERRIDPEKQDRNKTEGLRRASEPLSSSGGSSPWGGLSGALVFYRDLAVGVIVEHHPRQGNSALRLIAFDKLARVAVTDPAAGQVAAALELPEEEDLEWAELPALLRAREVLEQKRAVLSNQFFSPRRKYLPLDPRRSLEAFLDSLVTEDWGSTCRETVGALHADFQLVAPTGRVANHLSEVRDEVMKAKSWEQLHGVISRIQHLDVERSVGRLRSSVSPGDFHLNKDWLAVLEGRAAWLKTQSIDPTFGRCILIAGAWGSGKSRFLLEVIEWCLARQWQAVLIKPKRGSNLQKAVLEQAEALYGQDLQSWGQLKKLLRTLKTKLLILFDDLHEVVRNDPAALQEVADLVRDNTSESSIYWIATADELHLDKLSSERMAPFWKNYGTSASKAAWPTVGDGWIRLDELNSHYELGLNLIQEHGSESNSLEIAAARRNKEGWIGQPASMSLINNPLPAWICIEADAGENAIADLNRPTFVRQYWKLLRSEFSWGAVDVDVVERLIPLIARFFAESDTSRLRLQWLIEGIQRISKDRGQWTTLTISECIAALHAAGLLSVQRIGDIEVDEVYDEVELVPEAFWGHRIALQLVTAAGETAYPADQLHTALSIVGLRAGDGDWVAEAICQFGLSAAAERLDDETATTVWQLWRSEPECSLLPFLLAGVWAPARLRELVIDKAEKTSPNLFSDRDVFAFLRLILWTNDPSWPADRRVQRVQAFYGRIQQLGLSQYLLHSIDVVVRERGYSQRARYLSLLSGLTGIEAARIAPAVARIVVNHGWDLFNQNIADWAQLSFEFLGCSLGKGGTRDFPPPASTQMMENEKYFWMHFVKKTAEVLVTTHGVKAFLELAELGWYSAWENGTVSQEVGLLMKTEVNTALGANYRKLSSASDEYHALIRSLLASSVRGMNEVQQKTAAFYLIKHSVVTHATTGLKVQKVFHDPLMVLWKDQQMRKVLGRQLEDILRANKLLL